MKWFFIIIIIFVGLLFVSCSHTSTEKNEAVSNKDTINNLMQKYAPGLGEIMGGIQTHHAKLWFAAINDNWKLAQYEIDELKERFEQARDIETNRPEIKMIPVMYPAIDSIKDAISHKNLTQFKSGFQLLTASCNSCHAANNFEFNVITIPTGLPVTNQDFKVR